MPAWVLTFMTCCLFRDGWYGIYHVQLTHDTSSVSNTRRRTPYGICCCVLVWLWSEFPKDSCDVGIVRINHHDDITRVSCLIKSPANWLFVEEFIHTYCTGGFPSQRASDTENISISWPQRVWGTNYDQWSLYYIKPWYSPVYIQYTERTRKWVFNLHFCGWTNIPTPK